MEDANTRVSSLAPLGNGGAAVDGAALCRRMDLQLAHTTAALNDAAALYDSVQRRDNVLDAPAVCELLDSLDNLNSHLCGEQRSLSILLEAIGRSLAAHEEQLAEDRRRALAQAQQQMDEEPGRLPAVEPCESEDSPLLTDASSPTASSKHAASSKRRLPPSNTPTSETKRTKSDASKTPPEFAVGTAVVARVAAASETGASDNMDRIVAVIVSYDPHKMMYHVEDVEEDEETHRKSTYTVAPAHLTAISPSNDVALKTHEFAVGATVYALFPNTTCYYRATVKHSPSGMSAAAKRRKSASLTYTLQFDDDYEGDRLVEREVEPKDIIPE